MGRRSRRARLPRKFAPAPMPPFSPSDIPGLRLWLKGDAGLVTVAGRLQTWQDQSGSGNDFDAPATRPFLAGQAINGVPAVGFVASLLTRLAWNPSNPTAAEMFIVKQNDNDATNIWGLYEFSPDDSDYLPFVDGSTYDGFGSTTRKTLGVLPDAKLPHIYNVKTDTNLWSAYTNNGLSFTTATNTVGWSAALAIGGNIGVTTYTGRIGEMLVYGAGVLTAPQHAQVVQYLATKWGIAI